MGLNLKLSGILIFVLVISACGSDLSSNDPSTNKGSGNIANTTDASALSPAQSQRDWLTMEALLSNEYPHASPIHNSYFLPVGESSEALHHFSGRIQINSRQLLGGFVANHISGDESFKNFPDVSLEFISHQGKLIPLNRARQLSPDDDSFWGIILDPGRVWSEASDNGWSRASFPFSFISARRNQVHNGIASFLYNDSEISHLRIQVPQETTLWFRRDIYAQLATSYLPQKYPNEAQIIQAFTAEEANTVTIHPWQSLASLSQPANSQQFNSYLDHTEISSAGVIIDGEVYAQPCYTRYGDFPYCRWLRNGAYSVTKSLGASLTMMRLAQKYGAALYDLKIKDYLEITADHDGWQDVTFAHMLNMASGIGDNGASQHSGDIFADENTNKMERWLVKASLEDKLKISFSYDNYSWGPGAVFRYNSAMTIVLAAALDRYYKSIEGADADLWQMMIDEVFTPIGIQHVPILRTDESNGTQGIAELFHGLYPNIDDLAKLTNLLQNNGAYQGEQLLHQEKLTESLFKTSNQGLHSWWEDNRFGRSRYLYSFWSSPYDENGNCPQQIPYMSGYGGNIVALLPNNITLYRFADAEAYSPFDMIQASVSERAICQ